MCLRCWETGLELQFLLTAAVELQITAAGRKRVSGIVFFHLRQRFNAPETHRFVATGLRLNRSQIVWDWKIASARWWGGRLTPLAGSQHRLLLRQGRCASAAFA